MNPAIARFCRWQAWLAIAALLLQPCAGLAHERFIQHTPKWPLHEEFFQTLNPQTLQQLNPNHLRKPGDPDPATLARSVPPTVHPMLQIAGRVTVLITLMLFVWFMRRPLDYCIENVLLGPVKGKGREWICHITAFIFDEPVEVPLFKRLGEWVVIFFLRSPALVLMFAAANRSLVMPSYPLEPSTLKIFQFTQVLIAIGILTQTLLPLEGAAIFGTFLFLLKAYDWKIAVDVLPVLTAAVVYVSSPWDSWKQAITTISTKQMRWVRIVLGFSFFTLGWMKIYNYYLTVGVADNYPSVLLDPMIRMFWAGTAPAEYTREAWIIGFALAEVMTGFLFMVGVFSRIWSLAMVYVFTKLMVVDFGWAEIPHIYPISALLAVLFSNNLTNEFYQVDAMGKPAGEKGRTDARYVGFAFALAIGAAAAIIWPMLMLLTQVPRPRFF
jgi:uncharacterized membrane protein YphA (DoxX/SURF4 family)